MTDNDKRAAELVAEWCPQSKWRHVVTAIARALDAAEERGLPFRVVHKATNEVVAAFKYADIAQRYCTHGAACGGWRPDEVEVKAKEARDGE